VSEDSQEASAVAAGPSIDPGQFESGEFLRDAGLLTPQEASSSLSAAGGRVIVWAGARESGKTTLSAELYERHRQNKAKTRFVSSRTLLGLEERIHPSRLASRRVKPHTPRTDNDPEERELLHLCVSDGEAATNLILGDLPGETFKRFVSNQESPADLPLIARADKLAFLADGELLAKAATRPRVASFLNQLIERFKKAGLPDASTQTLLLLTKYDQIRENPQALAYWEAREQELLAKLRAIAPDAFALRTAARSEDDEIDDGMEDLMEWILRPPAYKEDPDLPQAPASKSGIDRLARPKRLR
jgi:Double-GTPase 2